MRRETYKDSNLTSYKLTDTKVNIRVRRLILVRN